MGQETLTNILLIDDHPVVRMGYASLLRQLDSDFVFREAGSRAEALEIAALYRPSIALLDLTFDGVLELSLIADLLRQAPDLAILVVSMHDERLYAERALRAGAKGYVMKHHAAQSIIQALQTVRQGEIWLSENMRNALMHKALAPEKSRDQRNLATLSDREFEVFRLLGLGLKKAEIASRLNLSVNTIETYRSHLKQKLGIATGAELYRFAFLHFQNNDTMSL